MKKLSFFLIFLSIISLSFVNIYGYWSNKLNSKIKMPILYNVDIEITGIPQENTNDSIENTNIVTENTFTENIDTNIPDTQLSDVDLQKNDIDDYSRDQTTKENSYTIENIKKTDNKEEIETPLLAWEVENDTPKTTD